MAGKNIDKRELMLHILFWMTWIISFTVVQSLGKGWHEFTVWLIYYIVTLPVFLAHTYLIAYWLIPKTFFKGRYFLFILGLFFMLIFFSVAELLISNNLVFKPFDSDKVYAAGFLNFKNIFISGIGNHYIILVFLAIKAGRSWYRAKNENEELLRSNEETEIEIYNYQSRPVLILTLMEELEQVIDKTPEKTSEMIVKISGFLNRLLYEGSEELIPLELDIKLTEDFFDIHQLALGERLTRNIVVSGHLKPFVVPPLLLLPYLNNLTKMMYECNESFECTVIIKGEKKYLLFSFAIWSENEFSLSGAGGVEIIRKRLDYIFPGKHRLTENMDVNFREIKLEIFK